MNPRIDILRGELERLFSLEELTQLSHTLLGLDPSQVGGQSAKASFAKALTERCADGNQLEALVDAILVSKPSVDPRVRDYAALLGRGEFGPGKVIGPFTIVRKLGESELSTVYLAKQDGKDRVLKVLRGDACRDKSAVQRFLTANRLVATVKHEGLPAHVSAGELTDEYGAPLYYVTYDHVDGQTLAVRFARTGPAHINELRAILRGILEPLGALHKGHLIHGDLKLENVLLGRGTGEGTKVVLIDFGADRLRQRSVAANGHTGVLAVLGSPRTIAPELVRGRAADHRSDLYAFGCMAYELLSGKAVFASAGATEAAFRHLSEEPTPPSTKAPRGWIGKEVDAFVLSLLQKEPEKRPKSVAEVIETLEGLGRASVAMRAAQQGVSPERLAKAIDALMDKPMDSEAALELEKAVEEGADPQKVAVTFELAADAVEGDSHDAREAKKGLLYRAARTFHSALKDKERTEKVYLKLIELDPTEEVAQIGLEEVQKELGKYEAVVERLLLRSEAAPPGDARARVLAEIGRLCAHELEDPDQAILAYAQALSETPTNAELADEIERLGGDKAAAWAEVLSTITEGIKGESLSTTERNQLLAYAGKWYDQKAGRADMALMAYQQILTTDPANDEASDGLLQIYRRAQQWPELVALLLSRAEQAGASPRGRDLRAEAGELVESKLSDAKRAKDVYEQVIGEDPGHPRAGDALLRLAEKEGDFATVVKILAVRAEARRGQEKVDALVRIAETYEDQLNDLTEAERRFESVLALDPSHLAALKGLDRIFNRTGKYRELLDNLERQIQLAATPRQKINLYERVASLYDEEFLDHALASAALENILLLDASNDGAMTRLARHYRAESRFEDLVTLYDKHAAITHDDARRVELLIARSRVLAEQVGSPERATRSYEQVLERAPGHAGALEALARLRELSGDAHAALFAIEALAAKATTPEAKAEQWMRAARVLEGRGDRDGAIERYKMALEANPKDAAASLALRQAYALRGDTKSAVALIEKELQFAEGPLVKARLHAELARHYKEHLKDLERAEASAKTANELDATNPDALVVLGDLAFDAERFLEANRHYDGLLGRLSVLEKEERVRVLVRFIESFGKSVGLRASVPASRELSPRGSVVPPSAAHPRLANAVELLQEIAPDDPTALFRVGRVLFEHADPAGSKQLFQTLLEKHGRELGHADRAEALHALGESRRRLGDLEGAVTALREAADADPGNPAPLRALARVYEDKEAWDEVIRIKRRRLEVATGSERFDLLLEIGDVEFQKLGDRTKASRTYVLALEERPDDRKLLTKLMQLYSEEKDWAKLVEVVLRLADFVDDEKQRAKYLNTAAIVSARQLGEVDNAISYYTRALEFDASLPKALDELIELHKQKGNHDSVEGLLKSKLDRAKASQDRATIVHCLDELGALYQKFLNEPDLAVDAYEAAQAFDPDKKERAEVLAELYASDVTQYLDKAVRSQAQLLARNPYRVESYKLLRKLYTDARKADASWCLCQALSVLKLAEPDEERFYKRHRADNAAPAQAPLSEKDWEELVYHVELDPLVTRVFALIQPTIIRARSKPLEQMGYDPRYAIDPALHPYPVSQTLYYVQGVFGFKAPSVFQNQNDPVGLGFVHATTPGIVLGRAAFELSVPNQSLAFVAGRHLAYFRPGLYVRQLVPTGTGLKAWFFAAIKLCVPQFPVAPDLGAQVSEAMGVLAQDFQGAAKDKLSSLVSKLLAAGGAVDLKKWVSGVDLTADRAGLIVAHDLEVVTEVMRATEDASSVPGKERTKEAVLYTVSEQYVAIRQKLSIAIDS